MQLLEQLTLVVVEVLEEAVFQDLELVLQVVPVS
jgi:hypothetical protein